MTLSSLASLYKILTFEQVKNAVSTKAAAVATLAQASAAKVAAVATNLWTYSAKLANRAGVMMAFGAKSAAAGTMALSLAIRGLMIATGVGAVIATLTGVIALFTSKSSEAAKATDEASAAAEKAKAAIEAENQAVAQGRAALELNIAKTKDFNGTKEEEAKLVGELNTTYGETMGYFSSVADWYKALTANSEAYCQQLVNEARARRLANQIADEKEIQDKILYKEDGTRKGYSTRRERRAHMVGKTALGNPQYEYYETESDKDKAEAAYRESKKREKRLNDQLARVTKPVSMAVTGSRTNPNAPTGGRTNTGSNGGKNTGAKTEPEAPKDSIAWYEKQIADLNKQISITPDEIKASALVEQKEKLEKEMGELRIRVGLDEPTEQDLATLKKNIKASLTEEAVDAPAEDVLPTDIDGKRERYSIAENQASQLQEDVEIGLIGADEAAKKLAEINELLVALGLKPIDIKFSDTGADKVVGDTEKSKGKVKDLTDAAETMGNMFSSAGSAFSNMGDESTAAIMEVAAATSQAVATMIPQIMSLIGAKEGEAMATGTAEAAKIGFPQNIAAIATTIAAILSVIGTIASVTAFANGGIVSGPTYALVGEYGGAANNPEVIAPLDKLRSMLQPQGGVGGNISLQVRGRQLVGVLANETRVTSKSGRRTNIKI